MKSNFSLYRNYSQKSRIFLYPALGIKRSSSVKPIQTYITIEGRYGLEDYCLTATFQIRTDDEYKLFVKNVLKGNKYFKEAFEITNEEKIIIVFNLIDFKKDWDNFILGKYSKLSVYQKNNILSFYKTNPNNLAYIESYLYPYKYNRLYADALSSSEHEADEMYILLKQVGELCSKPDLEKENLVVDVSKLVLVEK
jgi:hypothetical protein